MKFNNGVCIMQNLYKHRTVLLSLFAIVALVAISACAKRTPPPPEPVKAAAVYPSGDVYVNERAVLVHRGDESPRRYYRDDRGKLYYVDQNGAVHDIERNA
jgi:hypothetical protein